MKLYKYKSLEELWNVLDIIVNQRLYCSRWQDLNDPLEGRYEVYFGDKNKNKNKNIQNIMTSRIENARDSYRVVSLTSDPTNFLMWSHYANGHKGIVIEVDISEDHEDLCKVLYSPFLSVFSNKSDTNSDMKHLFNGKSEEWKYEEEYRIITESEFFPLSKPVCRVLVGPMVSNEQKLILKNILPDNVEIIHMELDKTQGILIVNSPSKNVKRTPSPSRFKTADNI